MNNHYKKLREQKIQKMENRNPSLESLKKKISNSGGSGSAATAEAPGSTQPNFSTSAQIKIEQAPDNQEHPKSSELVEAGEFGNPRMMLPRDFQAQNQPLKHLETHQQKSIPENDSILNSKQSENSR